MASIAWVALAVLELPRNVSQSIRGESSHCRIRIGGEGPGAVDGRSLQLPIDVVRLRFLRFQCLLSSWLRRRSLNYSAAFRSRSAASRLTVVSELEAKVLAPQTKEHYDFRST